uniref:Uncharacterized protein n=1 Tax=Hemiselmis andersenii TaxID=464988 RepID=A0A6T8P846_HEMAN
MAPEAARRALRASLHNLQKHFVGRNGTTTGDVKPYMSFLVEACRRKPPKSADPERLAKDIEGFDYYLTALIEKKALLSSFGGDNVRNITQRVRIEDTAKRVGLSMPEYQTEALDVDEYQRKIGLKVPGNATVRGQLEGIAKETGGK